MTEVFQSGIFAPRGLADERAATVLEAAADRAAGMVRPGDVLAAAIAWATANGDPRVLAPLAQALATGATPGDVLESIDVYNPARATPTDFDGRRERFSPELLVALDEFAAQPDGAGLEALLACVLTNLDAEDRSALGILDSERAATLLRGRAELAAQPLPPLLDAASGRLRSDEFTEAAWAVMEHAAGRAAELGYDRVLPPHCLLALLGETEGVAENVIRLQGRPEIGPAQVATAIADGFRLGPPAADAPPLELSRHGLGESCVGLLERAQAEARKWGGERIDSPHLLAALLDAPPARLASALEDNPLSLDTAQMRRHVAAYLRDAQTRHRREPAFRLPATLLPSEDLTDDARAGRLEPALHVQGALDVMTRALFRRDHGHVLVTGARGTGKTTLVRELARSAANGEIGVLRRKRFLWVDCADVAPEQSREKLAGALAHVAGRTDVILCLDRLDALLRAPSGANNKVVLRAALKAGRVRLIGVMPNTDFEDLLSADHELREHFTRVVVEEPGRDEALDIARQGAATLQQQYGLTIEAQALARAVVMAADYVLNERFPAKALKILRQACELCDYERRESGARSATVTVAAVTRVVAELSGIPETTLSGAGESTDYARDLGAAVVGQDAAVMQVADELRLVKAGLTRPDKPSVLMFAGLTGVGKTELAKVLARFYSSSKRLQTYTMANFTERHSVSSIVGVPPGYVGHDQGGRLVNDLNADPYCVFLLDEAEKAHAEVWKPFLNLFDEGWIVDQRGVKAFADRAIFILTSNAGHDLISGLAQKGAPEHRLEAAVREALADIRHEGSLEPVFPPEFLARIKRIIVFRPLTEEAMEGICRLMVARTRETWLKRDKTLVVPDALIAHIAHRGHALDRRSGFNEGGRIVEKLVEKLIQVSIVSAAEAHPREFRESDVIELSFAPPEQVAVAFRTSREVTVREHLARASSELEQGLVDGHVAELVDGCLARLESGFAGARPQEAEAALARLREARAQLELRAQRAEQEDRALVEELVRTLTAASPEVVADA